ncbi:TetR/AcrR family transcriptional regulator [Acidomonas methanolica]|uniref:TetR/AcrR family transcriptional regulator n=1 Tax=Acidomonas methanolica TaxID=437 RepID=UPI00211A8BB2|nr:TetR/AcrR family transcriptional regulator [Acidomonas methanolica]MCQ9156262.1 TetR/AcrR family transcriptional regulator [Acidomonas methanolica]
MDHTRPTCLCRAIGRRPPAPGDAERKERVLDAAVAVLQEHGYQAASMDRIAALCGMSKKTLYQLFESRQLLFESLLVDRLFNSSLIDLELQGATPRERLCFGMRHLAAELLAPKRIVLLRAVVSELSRVPEIATFLQGYFADNSRVFPLHSWLRRLGYDAILTAEELDTASEHLFGMTVGLLMLGDLAQCKPPRTPEGRQAFIESGVTLFLRAFPLPVPASGSDS